MQTSFDKSETDSECKPDYSGSLCACCRMKTEGKRPSEKIKIGKWKVEAEPEPTCSCERRGLCGWSSCCSDTPSPGRCPSWTSPASERAGTVGHTQTQSITDPSHAVLLSSSRGPQSSSSSLLWAQWDSTPLCCNLALIRLAFLNQSPDFFFFFSFCQLQNNIEDDDDREMISESVGCQIGVDESCSKHFTSTLTFGVLLLWQTFLWTSKPWTH